MTGASAWRARYASTRGTSWSADAVRSGRGAARQALVGGVVVAREERAEAIAGLVERARGEEHGLVLGDVVVLRAHGDDVEGPDLRRPELVELAEGGQE